MASLRKKYSQVDGPPVSTPPTTAADLPPVEARPPPELPPSESPVDKAAKEAIALQLRLKEMERAEQLNRAAAEQPPPPPPQEAQQPTLEDHIAHLPPRVQGWYRKHPELATDPEKVAQVQYCHHVAAREVGEQFTEPYYDRMEQMLNLAPRVNGQTQPRLSPAPAAAPRYESPPVRQQQRSAFAYSAPPTREVPSMSTGRPSGRQAPLTRDEIEIALASKLRASESDEAAIRRYQYNREKMNKMKANGEIQDGR